MNWESTDIAIVGGGASGVLLAVHLVRAGTARTRVTLVDRGHEVGLGVAYATRCADHLLNVRADNMSAVADEPDHLVAWLAANGERCDGEAFVPRMTYGRYLRSVLQGAVQQSGGRLSIVAGDVVAASECEGGMSLAIDGASPILARRVVLATGHHPPAADRGAYRGDPWRAEALEDLPLDASVLVIGTGLTMVDIVVSLLERQHTGPIVAVSRRGLLPRTHPERQDRNPGCNPEALFSGPLSSRLAAFRDLAAASTWEDVMQKLRHQNTALWHSLDPAQKQRFLRHLRPWWDVHRHRIAPRIGLSLAAAMQSGQLTVSAGRVASMQIEAATVRVSIIERGTGRQSTRDFDRVIDCSGPRNSVQERSSLQMQLMQAGLLRNDPLHLGLEVDPDDAVIGASGEPSPLLFALGPPTRGRHWEINAVPDIRNRAARLAGHLLASMNDEDARDAAAGRTCDDLARAEPAGA